MSTEHIHESREGHFALCLDNEVVGLLYYTLNLSKNKINDTHAILETPPSLSLDKNKTEHYFRNGGYTHSQIVGVDILSKFKLPLGMALYLPIPHEEIKKQIAQLERKPVYTGVDSKIPTRLDKETKLIESIQVHNKRFNPISVIIEPFSLTKEIKASLRDVNQKDSKLIKLLLGNHFPRKK